MRVLSSEGILQSLTLSHAELYTDDLTRTMARFVEDYGFEAVAHRARTSPGGARSVVLCQGSATLVVTEVQSPGHPVAEYVNRHGEGVGDLALRTADAREAFRVAVARGARPVHGPIEQDGFVLAAINGFGDVRHTLVQPPSGGRHDAPLPGFIPVAGQGAASSPGESSGLTAMDHFAVCVPPGTLDEATGYYADVLGFVAIFEERIERGDQLVDSRAIRNRSGDCTLTILSPRPGHAPGQIDSFLEAHRGAGVQHIAFSTPDIVRSVSLLRDRGTEFLTVPNSYYDLLGQRLTVKGHTLDELRELNVLADEDHDGQLYQLFSRSTHVRRTLFFEIIQRLGARGFGGGNVKALYEAVETDQSAGARAGVTR
ncbi:4-hydroxyphenylpyruvate dioxygenase [Streptomyces sp. NPDC057271]|uniref:4-hydroxyphenylpyruvate dioxygenase n=1 Tax=unclassified Streptomyces TaxID=2593676 RepID=UPI00363B3227